ncbi:acyl-CoA dehydrogenase family protein [Microbacterium sp. NPDC089696]|uniref:acyl-CoA dehydrogenase family protein n=1 Tax=Microbacterium sp. NPDC089696 TaxID=3364199 RepID=UPI003830C8DC
MASQQTTELRKGAQVPEPGLTEEEVVVRAVALRPLLRANRIKAAEDGSYSTEIHETFDKAGFYRLVQPRKYGGYEFSLETQYRVMVEISRGDPGIGWCLTLGTAHTIPLVSYFPEAVVSDAFGDDGLFIASHSASSRGVAVPTEGGYLLSGSWGYSSGVAHSTHAMVTAAVQSQGEVPELIVALLPREDYTVLDDWNSSLTMALGASGSQTVKIEGAFVPADRTVPFDWQATTFPEETIGVRSTGNPLYLAHIGPLYAGTLACIQVGAAKAALDEYTQIITTKKRTFAPQVERYKHPDAQLVYAEARAMIEAAEAVVYAGARDFRSLGERWLNDDHPALEEWLAVGNMLYTAIQLAHEATELLFRSVGSSVARKGVPLQDYFLATQMQKTQLEENKPHFYTSLAKAHFGLE